MALSALFWAAVALLYAVQGAVRRGGFTDWSDFPRSAITSLVSFSPCVILTPPVAALALRYRFGDGRWRRAALAHAAGLVAFAVVAGAMMAALAWLLPWERAAWHAAGVTSLGAAARWGALVYVAPDTLIYVLVVAAAQAAAYAREARARTVREAQLRAELAEARLHALSAQLQPHFLFNTLHAISALVREEPHQAERLLARLSELLRHALADAPADATLGEELAFLEKYVEIQEARFGERLRVTFDVDPALRDVRVPRLLLQPLVENAVRHGISRRAASGRVEISARRDGARVRLAVRDDGVGLPAERQVREGIGLATTRARLRHFYGDDFTLELTDAAGEGALCALDLPLRGAHASPVIPAPPEPLGAVVAVGG
jgi:signal transduction histidine kinase